MNISFKIISETRGFNPENDQILKRSHLMETQNVQKIPPAAELSQPQLSPTPFLFSGEIYYVEVLFVDLRKCELFSTVFM